MIAYFLWIRYILSHTISTIIKALGIFNIFIVLPFADFAKDLSRT